VKPAAGLTLSGFYDHGPARPNCHEQRRDRQAPLKQPQTLAAHPQAYDLAVRRRLRRISEQLTGLGAFAGPSGDTSP